MMISIVSAFDSQNLAQCLAYIRRLRKKIKGKEGGRERKRANREGRERGRKEGGNEGGRETEEVSEGGWKEEGSCLYIVQAKKNYFCLQGNRLIGVLLAHLAVLSVNRNVKVLLVIVILSIWRYWSS